MCLSLQTVFTFIFDVTRSCCVILIAFYVWERDFFFKSVMYFSDRYLRCARNHLSGVAGEADCSAIDKCELCDVLNRFPTNLTHTPPQKSCARQVFSLSSLLIGVRQSSAGVCAAYTRNCDWPDCAGTEPWLIMANNTKTTPAQQNRKERSGHSVSVLRKPFRA